MSLTHLKDSDKAKGFDLIIEAYNKDSDIKQFGQDVQEILKWMKVFFI